MVSNESHEVGENESSAYLGRSGQRTSASRVSKGDSVHFVKEGRRERDEILLVGEIRVGIYLQTPL